MNLLLCSELPLRILFSEDLSTSFPEYFRSAYKAELKETGDEVEDCLMFYSNWLFVIFG